MKIEAIKHFFTFIILCLIQALVLNHITFFGCATPLLYVYFIMQFRRDFPKWGIILWSFLLGLCMDVFSNTPGVAAAASTLLGFLQPYLLNLFIQNDSEEDLLPSMNTLGVSKFIYFTVISVLIYNIVFFTLEAFNFFNWQQWLLNIGGSTLLTTLLIITIDNVKKR